MFFRDGGNLPGMVAANGNLSTQAQAGFIPTLSPHYAGSEGSMLRYLEDEVEHDEGTYTLLDEVWQTIHGEPDPYVSPVEVFGDTMYLPTTLVQKMMERQMYDSGFQGGTQDAGWVYPWL